MNKTRLRLVHILTGLLFCAAFLVAPAPAQLAASQTQTAPNKAMIYDEAGLLTPQQIEELNALANRYAVRRQTDILIYTSNNPDNLDVIIMTQDFFDNYADSQDQYHENGVVLTLDMRNRDIYLAGFGTAEYSLDDERLDKIRTRMTPDLSAGNYERAFQTYIETAHRYMGYRPGVNPDNILFNTWFQLAVSLGIGGVVVGSMAYTSGGRITVNRQTYEDTAASGILDRRDRFLRTTTTRRKIPKNTGGGGGGSGRIGGGGGISGGGRSHSGSRGKF